MKIKELIVKLKKYDQELNVTLDTCEGADFLDIDQVYNDEFGVVLYGSIMNLNQSRIMQAVQIEKQQ